MQTHFFIFPISLKLTEREVRELGALCDQGGWYAVQYLEGRYRYVRHIDALRVVKQIREMKSSGSLPTAAPVQGGINSRYRHIA